MTRSGEPPKDKRAEKETALAAALRANLRRRKSGAGKSAPAKPAKPADEKGP